MHTPVTVSFLWRTMLAVQRSETHSGIPADSSFRGRKSCNRNSCHVRPLPVPDLVPFGDKGSSTLHRLSMEAVLAFAYTGEVHTPRLRRRCALREASALLDCAQLRVVMCLCSLKILGY